MLEGLIILLLGYILGAVITKLLDYRKPIGTLKVDNSDPDGTHLFLELTTDPNRLESESYVVFKVDKSNYLSQE